MFNDEDRTMLVKSALAAVAVSALVIASPASAQQLITFDVAAFGALPGKALPSNITARPLLQPGGDIIAMRASLPANAKIGPHPHPAGKVAIVTVLSGDFKVGLGDKFDEAGLKTVAPGGVIVFRDNDPQHYARTGNGPVELLVVAGPKAAVSPALLGGK
jgi:quercetin dioxygenase-like cupin family protein